MIRQRCPVILVQGVADLAGQVAVVVRAGVFGRVKFHHGPICWEMSPIPGTPWFQVPRSRAGLRN